jgi:hypothetical protein
MTEAHYDSLQLVGLHRPDFSVETDDTGHKYTVELPGTYSLGAMVGGTFVELYSVKAGNLVDAIKTAQNPPTAAEPAGEPEPQPGT